MSSGEKLRNEPVGTAETLWPSTSRIFAERLMPEAPWLRRFWGSASLDGADVEVNYQEAFRLLLAAAKQGTSRSVVNLARMYEEGLGVEKDVAEAIRLYKTVAKVEFFAQIALGRIYSSGKSVVADRAQALRYYSSAIEWGDRVVDCEEMQEAKEFVAKYPK